VVVVVGVVDYDVMGGRQFFNVHGSTYNWEFTGYDGLYFT
jgi:hypothetical protein